MVASIFSFAKRRVSSEQQSQRRDWTTQELAEFYRISERLQAAGLNVSVYRGSSDEGDPWAVFERDDTADIIVHIACIDGMIVVVNTTTGQTYRGENFRAITDQMLHEVPLVMPRQVKKPGDKDKNESKIVYHPSAVLTAFVAAAIVLTEFASNVQAAEASESDSQAPSPLETGNGLFLDIMAKLLSRDTAQTLQSSMIPVSALGVLGAAAYALETAYHSLTSDTEASVVHLDDFDEESIIAALMQAGTSNSDSKSSAHGEQSGIDANIADVIPGEPESDAIDVVKVATTASQTVTAEKSDGLVASLDKEAELQAVTIDGATPVEGLIGADGDGAVQSGHDGDTTQASTPDQTTGEAASSVSDDPLVSAADASQPILMTSAQKETVFDSLIFSDLSTASASGNLLVTDIDFTNDLPQEIALQPDNSFDNQETLVADAQNALEPARLFAMLHLDSNASGTKTLSDNNRDVIIFDGGHSAFYNFNFEQDFILVKDSETTSSWIKDLQVIGNDIHIIGADGGSIWLYDSFQSIV